MRHLSLSVGPFLAGILLQLALPLPVSAYVGIAMQPMTKELARSFLERLGFTVSVERG